MSNQAGAFYMFMKHVQRELREEGLQIDRIQELLPIAEPRWQALGSQEQMRWRKAAKEYKKSADWINKKAARPACRSHNKKLSEPKRTNEKYDDSSEDDWHFQHDKRNEVVNKSSKRRSIIAQRRNDYVDDEEAEVESNANATVASSSIFPQRLLLQRLDNSKSLAPNAGRQIESTNRSAVGQNQFVGHQFDFPLRRNANASPVKKKPFGAAAVLGPNQIANSESNGGAENVFASQEVSLIGGLAFDQRHINNAVVLNSLPSQISCSDLEFAPSATVATDMSYSPSAVTVLPQIAHQQGLPEFTTVAGPEISNDESESAGATQIGLQMNYAAPTGTAPQTESSRKNFLPFGTVLGRQVCHDDSEVSSEADVVLQQTSAAACLPGPSQTAIKRHVLPPFGFVLGSQVCQNGSETSSDVDFDLQQLPTEAFRSPGSPKVAISRQDLPPFGTVFGPEVVDRDGSEVGDGVPAKFLYHQLVAPGQMNDQRTAKSGGGRLRLDSFDEAESSAGTGFDLQRASSPTFRCVPSKGAVNRHDLPPFGTVLGPQVRHNDFDTSSELDFDLQQTSTAAFCPAPLKTAINQILPPFGTVFGPEVVYRDASEVGDGVPAKVLYHQMITSGQVNHQRPANDGGGLQVNSLDEAESIAGTDTLNESFESASAQVELWELQNRMNNLRLMSHLVFK